MKYLFVTALSALIVFSVTRTVNKTKTTSLKTESETILCEYTGSSTGGFEQFEEDDDFLEFKAEVQKKIEEAIRNGSNNQWEKIQ